MLAGKKVAIIYIAGGTIVIVIVVDVADVVGALRHYCP